MIPIAYINEWRNSAPWSTDNQVEQDLILSRALVEIYSDPFLTDSLAFRGGTALHKLLLQSAARYSEDIDLVQIKEGEIGLIIDALRKKLDPWLGMPKRNFNHGRATLIYKFDSESIPIVSMRLKIEINTREHFAVLGFLNKPFLVKNAWFTGHSNIITYHPEELLATKLRALYQRKKGRDLFDMAIILKKIPEINISVIIKCFIHYMEHTAQKISRAEFEANLSEKLLDNAFLQDIFPLLPSAEKSSYDPIRAIKDVQKQIICQLPGDAWKNSHKHDIFS